MNRKLKEYYFECLWAQVPWHEFKVMKFWACYKSFVCYYCLPPIKCNHQTMTTWTFDQRNRSVAPLVISTCFTLTSSWQLSAQHCTAVMFFHKQREQALSPLMTAVVWWCCFMDRLHTRSCSSTLVVVRHDCVSNAQHKQVFFNGRRVFPTVQQPLGNHQINDFLIWCVN